MARQSVRRQIIRRIFDAAAEPSLWSEALAVAKEMLRADAMLLEHRDPIAGSIRIVAAPGFEASVV